MKPFEEAWMTPNGELLTDGASHYNIAVNHIRKNDSEVYENFTKLCYDEEYTKVYEYMYSNGFARLYTCCGGLYVEARPEFRATHFRKAKKLAKDHEYFKEVRCDVTDRVLWSLNDTI